MLGAARAQLDEAAAAMHELSAAPRQPGGGPQAGAAGLPLAVAGVGHGRQCDDEVEHDGEGDLAEGRDGVGCRGEGVGQGHGVEAASGKWAERIRKCCEKHGVRCFMSRATRFDGWFLVPCFSEAQAQTILLRLGLDTTSRANRACKEQLGGVHHFMYHNLFRRHGRGAAKTKVPWIHALCRDVLAPAVACGEPTRRRVIRAALERMDREVDPKVLHGGDGVRSDILSGTQPKLKGSLSEVSFLEHLQVYLQRELGTGASVAAGPPGPAGSEPGSFRLRHTVAAHSCRTKSVKRSSHNKDMCQGDVADLGTILATVRAERESAQARPPERVLRHNQIEFRDDNRSRAQGILELHRTGKTAFASVPGHKECALRATHALQDLESHIAEHETGNPRARSSDAGRQEGHPPAPPAAAVKERYLFLLHALEEETRRLFEIARANLEASFPDAEVNIGPFAKFKARPNSRCKESVMQGSDCPMTFRKAKFDSGMVVLQLSARGHTCNIENEPRFHRLDPHTRRSVVDQLDQLARSLQEAHELVQRHLGAARKRRGKDINPGLTPHDLQSMQQHVAAVLSGCQECLPPESGSDQDTKRRRRSASPLPPEPSDNAQGPA